MQIVLGSLVKFCSKKSRTIKIDNFEINRKTHLSESISIRKHLRRDGLANGMKKGYKKVNRDRLLKEGYIIRKGIL